MDYMTIGEQDAEANRLLRFAIVQERRKKWEKVTASYKELLHLLSTQNLPSSFEHLPWYRVFLFESYFHLAVAQQYLGLYSEALLNLTKSIEAVFTPKNGCAAGCSSNSVLMTPLYARRALVYCQIGEVKKALVDAEKAVILDNKNSAVYCVRALVRSTRADVKQALEDLKMSLKYNTNDVCALILRGNLTSQATETSANTSIHPDHKKACDINPSAHNYLDVQNCAHRNILDFYDRFIYSLTVPHTVTTIPLVKSCNDPPQTPNRILPITARSSSKNSDRTMDRSGAHSALSISSSRVQSSCDISSSTDSEQQAATKPFRCGTPIDKTHGMNIILRQKAYGEAIRKHNNRAKSAQDFFELLEKQAIEKMKHDYYQLHKDVVDNRQVSQYHRCCSAQQKTFSARLKSTKISATPTITAAELLKQNAAFARNIKVFEEINPDNAPRMYYRPWKGDRLPSADFKRKTWATPFKV